MKLFIYNHICKKKSAIKQITLHILQNIYLNNKWELYLNNNKLINKTINLKRDENMCKMKGCVLPLNSLKIISKHKLRKLYQKFQVYYSKIKYHSQMCVYYHVRRTESFHLLRHYHKMKLWHKFLIKQCRINVP